MKKSNVSRKVFQELDDIYFKVNGKKSSRTELAKKVGVPDYYVNNWKSGLSSPKAEHVMYIAEYYGVNFDETMKAFRDRPHIIIPVDDDVITSGEQLAAMIEHENMFSAEATPIPYEPEPVPQIEMPEYYEVNSKKIIDECLTDSDGKLIEQIAEYCMIDVGEVISQLIKKGMSMLDETFIENARRAKEKKEIVFNEN